MQEQKQAPAEENPTLVMKEEPASLASGNADKADNAEKKNRKRNRNRKPKNAAAAGGQKDVEMTSGDQVEEKAQK